MARFITVGAAQMGPVGRNESRAAVVVRLLEMMREAKGRGCDLVVFTECALTPFFPRWWEDDLSACDRWFERELPGPETHLLFNEARKLGIGFHLGYAELAEEPGGLRRYNSSVLVGSDGHLIGKHRKIHLSGQSTQQGENPHRSYEKRYFDVGNLGFRAWRAFGGVVGMCLGNDRRWPETYRVLGLQGAEMILLGYNTVAEHPDHPELDHLSSFHSLLSMQAGAYQNGCFVIGVAKAGLQEGLSQIGHTTIIAPSGEVVTQCTSLSDELVVHRCNLDQTQLYKEHIFNFAANRAVEAYSLITKTRGAVPPCEPGQDLDRALDAPKIETEPIQKLFIEEYGYSPEKARELVERAKRACELAEPIPAEKPPEETPAPPKTPVRPRSADPLQAIREVFAEEYQYPPSLIEPLAEQVARALELTKSQESLSQVPPKPDKPLTTSASETLTTPEAEPGTEIVPLPLFPVAEDIGWLPGRFASRSPENSTDRVTAAIHRLMKDYRYPEATARKIAEHAESAWRRMHPPEEPPVLEPEPTKIYIPEEDPDAANDGQPLTAFFSQSPIEKTVPALSSEGAMQVYSVLTEKYGYSAMSARGIAERANSAWRRWQNALAETQVAESTPSKAPPLLKTDAPPTVVKETTSEAASAVLQAATKPAPPPEVVEEPFVVVPCPECEFPLKISQTHMSLLGRKARCPQCQTKFRLPESV